MQRCAGGEDGLGGISFRGGNQAHTKQEGHCKHTSKGSRHFQHGPVVFLRGRREREREGRGAECLSRLAEGQEKGVNDGDVMLNGERRVSLQIAPLGLCFILWRLCLSLLRRLVGTR